MSQKISINYNNWGKRWVLYSVPPPPYFLRHHLHPCHQQELGQCPNRTHWGWSPFMIFTHLILGWINPSSKLRHHRCFDLCQRKPSKSDSLLVSLKSASRTAAARDSSSSGASLPAPSALPQLLLLLSDNFSYYETILLRQVAPVHHHSVTFVHLATSVCGVRHFF